MKVPMLDMAAHHGPLFDDLSAALDGVLRGGRFINGPQVGELERAVAKISGCADGIGVSSGTDALLCALMALDIGAGDEVITTPFTFFATAGCIHRTGARPVFVDIDPRTFNLDPGQVEAAITERTRAILPVHLFGQMADMGPLTRLARQHGLAVIEDAAQAIGATRDGVPAGSAGAIGCFSFFPSKNLGGLGDGGMVVTNDADLAHRLRVFRAHGAEPKYFHAHVGGNFRLDTLQAAALLVKLPRLEGWSEARRQNAARYDALFADVEAITTPEIDRENISVFNQYVVRARDRDALADHLREHGVGTAIYYPLGLHMQRCFAELGHKKGDFPHTERAAEQVLALPVFPEMSRDQLQYVAGKVAQFYDRRQTGT